MLPIFCTCFVHAKQALKTARLNPSALARQFSACDAVFLGDCFTVHFNVIPVVACNALRAAYCARLIGRFLNPLRHFPTCALGGIREFIRRVALGKSVLPTPYLSIRYIRLVVGVVVRWKMWITGANPLRLPISRVDENVETTRENPKKAQLIHTPPAPDRAAGVCGASIYFSRMIFRSSTSAFFRF